MTRSDRCTACDAELGVGRFCVNCGRPVDSSPAPLFADEVDQPQEPAYAAPTTVTPSAHRARGGAAVWLPWTAGLVVLLLVGVVGLWLLLDGGREPTASATEATTSARAADRPGPEPSRSAEPAPSPSATETTETTAAAPFDLVDLATVSAPAPAPPSQDNSGNPTSYVADHLLDGVPETCWRTPGDATGETITFGFEEPVTLREVGLVNGYAKVGQDRQGSLDWYHGNRRVLSAQWVFDDGTTVTQDLGDTTAMQTIPVEVETTTVTLQLLEVSAPGTGRASRDYTAISGIALLGVTD